MINILLTNGRWSYGGNRIQIKAETHLLQDVHLALGKVESIGLATIGPRKPLQAKAELLSLLLANEQTRLLVWLFPLDYEKKHHFTLGHNNKPPSEVSNLLN
jgi:phosphatidylinositol 4-kinase